jgi:hypothetical protein
MGTESDLLNRFVELLADYDPDAAATVRRERDARTPAGPRPLGADDGSVGRLADARLLRIRLGELLAGREQRAIAASVRAEATREAIRLRGAELARREPVLARQWLKRLHEALTEVRLTVTSAEAEAVRRLHDESRHEVQNGSWESCDGFPQRLAVAVGRLSDGVLTRLDELLTELAVAVGAVAGDVPALPRRASALPLCAPPPAGSSWERRLAGVLGLFGGFGLARLVWGYRDALPAVFGVLAPAIAVGLGVTVCGLVHRGRRLSTQRAVLTRWTAESLADLRGRLDSEVARAVLTAERELGACLERAVAARIDDADAAPRASVEPVDLSRDHDDLERLRSACAELDHLLGDAVAGVA